MENQFLVHIKEVLEIENREILLTDIFRDYDEWDSLALLSLIAMLDDEYGVAIEEKVLKTLLTLEDLYQEVQTRTVK
ncbi:MAG: acyl carrier protein [Sediminibacterium sp.]|jgi:acyl carrier protein